MNDVIVLRDGLTHTEGPRWHDGRLWFSDLYSHRIYSMEEDGSDLRVELTVPGKPSGIGWLPDGRLVAASMHDRRLVRREYDGSVVTHADLGAYLEFEPNDMVMDD